MDEKDMAALDSVRRREDSMGLEYAYRRMWLHEWQGMYVVTGIGNCGDGVIKIPSAIRTEFGGGGVSFARDITVGKIGKRVFYGNNSVEGIALIKIYEIDDEAFAGCRQLKWIYLPKCLKKVGNGVFADCENLKIIFYEGTEEEFKKIKSTDENTPSNGVERLFVGGASTKAKIYYNCRL